MKNTWLSIIMSLSVTAFIGMSVSAQTASTDLKRTSLKVTDIFSKVEDSLKKEFATKALAYPPKEIFVRSFKYDRQLEVWVKNSEGDQFKLFKSYKVCLQSGTIGPKRMQGDYQVPEGFYYINEFNPNSNYHLSLGLNYPNSSDRVLSDPQRPGGDIYIHGSCASTGCIPIADGPIEELYVLASRAKEAGQEFIPVHIFPIKFNQKKSVEYLEQATKDNEALQQFSNNLKTAYDYFEEKKKLPVILVSKKGQYIVQ